MRTILWFILACNGMRYNACATVEIGDPCTQEELGMLECTKRSKSTIDIDCYETLLEDHDVAQCTEEQEGYIWTYYDSCTGGLQAITDGVQFECIQNQVYDCHDTIHNDDD